ncbi:MAG: porin [Piscinibacter sp.]|uniref:porin n=1 Tax=Piscinibacter TaxID=1114981 RepID=UPI000FDE728B|nr:MULTISPECIES: porin [Piscinibacter]MCW5663741.1 porin [Piscinibacter sp.]
MKKSMFILAALSALAAGANAQSSVTIYGLVDAGVQKGNGGSATNPGAPSTKAWNVAPAYANRLGLRGNEDLGGGMSAQFQLEHRFDIDTGAITNAASFWQGASTVQLTSAGLGSVYLGRDYTPIFWLTLRADPFDWSGVGRMDTATWAGFRAPNYGQGAGIRTSNTVGYKSPNLGGLTLQAAVGLSESTGAGRDNGFNVEYKGGPIYGGVGYEKVSSGTTDGDSLVAVTGAYDFGYVRPIVLFSRAKVGTATNKFMSIAATAPLGSGQLKVAYYRLDPEGSNNTQSKLGLGYNYFLSKRTTIYADLGAAREDTKTNNNAYSIGLRHTF